MPLSVGRGVADGSTLSHFVSKTHEPSPHPPPAYPPLIGCSSVYVIETRLAIKHARYPVFVSDSESGGGGSASMFTLKESLAPIWARRPYDWAKIL